MDKKYTKQLLIPEMNERAKNHKGYTYPPFPYPSPLKMIGLIAQGVENILLIYEGTDIGYLTNEQNVIIGLTYKTDYK